MNETEQEALNYLKNQEFGKAAKIYMQLALADPAEERFFVAAANCYDRLGDKKSALGLYKKALALNEQSIPALVNISTVYYELKKYEQTIYYAQKVLNIKPDYFAALLNIGNSYYSIGQYDEALETYKKMYEFNPNSYNVLLNLANTLYNLGRFAEVVPFAEQVINKRPNSADGYILAGNSLIELAEQEKAASYLKQAVQISPQSDWLSSSLANLFQKMGNWKQCLRYAWKVFALKGTNVSLDDHINFAYFLYEAQEGAINDEQKAVVEEYLSRWENGFPDNPVVHHTSCALRNKQEIAQMDVAYVKTLFDGFAPSFDEILHQLDYCVPNLIALAIREHLKTKLFKKRRILDLGCGTGLCGEAIKTYFQNEEFYGVDVSERMLEIAEKKDVYQELYADDILNFLKNCENVFHAVVAGDVLTYFGNLKPIFSELLHVIKVNGCFVFSVSKNVTNNDDYFLTPSGRFVHSLTYVKRLLKYYGFKMLSVEEKVLRHEGEKDVIGFIVVAQKDMEIVFE